MIRGETSDSIPIDLIIEILSRVPAKSITKFCCVSKLWGSMLHGPYFTELILTRSRARPRLLFAIEQAGVWRFYSSLQPQNLYEKSSSLEVAAEFHTKLFGNRKYIFPSRRPRFLCRYASGLVYIYGKWISNEGDYSVSAICNPSTRQYAILPKIPRCIVRYSFLGFDPIDKKYKVLSFMDYPRSNGEFKILTLGTGIMMWRKIQCPLVAHHLFCPSIQYPGICINGVLYYLVEQVGGMSLAIVCFDIRSEKFKFIKANSFCRHSSNLMNYKGKLGGIDLSYVDASGRHTVELNMWVLEDVEKPEWSKHVYTMPENKVFDECLVFACCGVTAKGEIVLSGYEFKKKSYYVFYFNPEKNTVEIQGFEEYHATFENFSRFNIFVDHAEDLNFIT